jgi:hypothetical protein
VQRYQKGGLGSKRSSAQRRSAICNFVLRASSLPYVIGCRAQRVQGDLSHAQTLSASRCARLKVVKRCLVLLGNCAISSPRAGGVDMPIRNCCFRRVFSFPRAERSSLDPTPLHSTICPKPYLSHFAAAVTRIGATSRSPGYLQYIRCFH